MCGVLLLHMQVRGVVSCPVCAQYSKWMSYGQLYDYAVFSIFYNSCINEELAALI
jgi:hypothetical protein